MPKKIIYILISFIVITIIATSCSRKEPSSRYKPPANVAEGAEQDMVKQRVLAFNLEGYNQKGTKSWQVKGESAESITEDRIRLDNIVATAYGEEAEAVITADKGIYDRSKNNVTLQKNVKATIKNSQGFNQEYVGIPTMSGAQDVSKTKAKNTKKNKIIITCDGEVEFNYDKNVAFFTKNVKVINEDSTLTADRIRVDLDTESKKITNISADGNVKISRGENITYSDKATYVESEKKVVLSGRPKIVIEQEGDMQAGLFGAASGVSSGGEAGSAGATGVKNNSK